MGSPKPKSETSMGLSVPLVTCALAAAWAVAFIVVGSSCQWLGNQHAYGTHTRAQVALAFALCCVCATWLLAEIVRLVGPLKIAKSNGDNGFEPVPTAEPETIGAASAPDTGETPPTSPEVLESG